MNAAIIVLLILGHQPDGRGSITVYSFTDKAQCQAVATTMTDRDHVAVCVPSPPYSIHGSPNAGATR